MPSIRSNLLLHPVILQLPTLVLGRALPESHLTVRTSEVPELIPATYNGTSNSSDLVSRDSNSYCGVDYVWWKAADWFYIYGSFYMDQFGAGIVDEIRGCGGSGDWTYESITNDPRGFHWKLTGWLLVGQRNCVGNALLTAGGNDRGGCTGAG